jgi:hypothetical protein
VEEMVRLGGLEPPTSGATNLRSNQLSYNRTKQADETKSRRAFRVKYGQSGFFASHNLPVDVKKPGKQSPGSFCHAAPAKPAPAEISSS